jgi:hypothetical protein
MSTSIGTPGETVCELPPLILHPFNERVSPASLLENSKAALILAGLIPAEGADPDTLQRRLLAGRYSEVRMLFFLGKDVFRWIAQCLECVEREPLLRSGGILAQSFARLLTVDPPETVRQKLLQWGVTDYSSIFTRAIGLNAMFTEPPPFDRLADEFLRNYHRYGDALYQCYMDSQPYTAIGHYNFRFQLFASGEYSRMLESEWSAGEGE